MLILCHGCFDLLHLGHVQYLQAAKSLGHFLIVTITADKYINKGPGRPLFNELHRQEMLQALKCVDLCEVLYEPTAVSAILKHKPDIYVKGIDYEAGDKTGRLDLEREAVESYGGRLLIIKSKDQFSSTEIMTGRMYGRKCALDT